MTSIHHSFFLICLGILLQGCSIPELATKNSEIKLPEHFSSHSSAGHSAQTQWRKFFDDPHLLVLIDSAIVGNQEVNMLLQRISMKENEIQARQGAYLPFVSLGGGIEGEKVGKYTFNGAVEHHLNMANNQPFPTIFGNYQFGLFSSWEIDIWKKLRNEKQIAILEYMASQEGRKFLVTNLVAEVARTYYELITLDNQLENLDQNIALQKNGLEIVEQLQFYARTTTLAVKRYQAEVAKNLSRRYEILQQITVGENRINFLLGRPPQPIERSSTGFMAASIKIIKAGIPAELLENRPDIRKAELELEAAELSIDVARANFMPSFGIKAGIGFHAFALKYLINTPESLAAMLAGELVAPLVNKNAIIANYKNANAKQIELAYAYAQTILSAYVEVANQIANIDNLSKSFELKNQQVESLVKAIDVASQLFTSARTDYLDVLLTQRDALEAKKDLIETKRLQVYAMVDLYRSLGGGWQ